MLEINNLSFSYKGRSILEEISFKAENGQFISILGRNGVGKSTLFKCILKILPNYSGQVLIDGEDALNLSVKEIAQRIAYIPQATASTFNYSVEDIVLFGTTSLIKGLRTPGEKEKELVDNALKKVGIYNLKERCFHHLSGGEKQLVIIARALAQNANILLLDEPASALDFGNQMRILSLIRQLSQEGYCVIQTTHDPESAFMFSDKIIALKDGRILSQGIPDEVLTQENINNLYGIDTIATSLYEDKVRVYTPLNYI